MNESTMNMPRPVLLTIVAATTLISGIVNLFWGFVLSVSAVGTILGIVCLPLTILPTILGIFEIVYAARVLSAQPQPTQPSQPIAVFQILCFLYGNIFSMIVGILALVFYNDLTVKDYFASLNNPTPPKPSNPVAPISIPAPDPGRLIPLPEEMPEESTGPATPPSSRPPSKPKPNFPRKVARK